MVRFFLLQVHRLLPYLYAQGLRLEVGYTSMPRFARLHLRRVTVVLAVSMGIATASVSHAQGVAGRHVTNPMWTTMLEAVVGWEAPDAMPIVLMAGDLPPAMSLYQSIGDHNRFPLSERMTRLGRLWGYDVIVRGDSFAFRPEVLPFHLLFPRHPDRINSAREFHGARPWCQEMLAGWSDPRPQRVVYQLRNPRDLVVMLRAVHSGTLGDLAAIPFSKRLDVSPVLRDAIVVARGAFTEHTFLRTLAAAVGGVFRETEETFVIDADPRVWRRMMIAHLERHIAVAPSRFGEEYLIIQRDALQAVSDVQLASVFEWEQEGMITQEVAWSSPLGQRVRRYLEYRTTEAFLPEAREMWMQLLLEFDWVSPLRIEFSRLSGLRVVVTVMGDPPSGMAVSHD